MDMWRWGAVDVWGFLLFQPQQLNNTMGALNCLLGSDNVYKRGVMCVRGVSMRRGRKWQEEW